MGRSAKRFGRLPQGVACAMLIASVQPISAQDLSASRRGKYLVEIAACSSCHTPVKKDGTLLSSMYLAGGSLMRGRIVPNITPDPSSGIGRWNDQQVRAALRAETRVKREPQLEFPIHGYANLSDDDLASITAYLRSIKPVSNKMLAPSPPPEDAARKSISRPDPVNILDYGFYVAQATGCLRCHSPAMNGVPDLTRPGIGGLAHSPFDGSEIKAPDITGGGTGGVASWSDAEIKRAITRGIRPNGSKLSPIMPFDAFDYLKETDQNALVAYLRSLK